MKNEQTEEIIFIVADMVENLQLLTKMLAEKGYRIRAAKAGREAIVSVLAEMPDLLLLDIQLQDISGFEVCQMIKDEEKTSHIPVIFFGGKIETEYKQKVFEAGGVDYINCPFVNEELVAKVNTHLEMSRMRKEFKSRAEKFQEKSADDFKELFDRAPVGYHEIDENGRIVRINETELEMLGYSLDEVKGQCFWQFAVDKVLSQQAIMLKLTGKLNTAESFERDFRRKDGTVISVLITDKLLESGDGKIYGIRSNVQDITRRKQLEKELQESEEKFRNIFEYSVVGKSITTIEGRVTVNKSFSDIIGYSLEELNQLNWKDITYPDDVEFKQNEIELLVRGIKKFAQFESRFVHKNGNVIWVEISSVLQRDNTGVPLYLISTINDITVRKQAELALEEKMNELIRFHDLTVDRELTMIELKKEVNELLRNAGQNEKYKIIQ